MTRTKAETSMTVRKDTCVSNPRSAHACFDSIRTSKDKRRESQSDESRARLSCALSRYQVPRPAAAAAADSTTGEELVRRTAARGFSPNKTTPAQSTAPLLQQYIVIKLAQIHTGDLASSLKKDIPNVAFHSYIPSGRSASGTGISDEENCGVGDNLIA